MSSEVLGQDAPIHMDLLFIKGDSFILDLNWQDEAGAPVSATGVTMTLHFDSSALGGTFPDPAGHLTLADGKVTISYTAAETAAFDFVSTRWWIDKTDSSGRTIRWMRGRARLED